jgi:hypothetical protein
VKETKHSPSHCNPVCTVPLYTPHSLGLYATHLGLLSIFTPQKYPGDIKLMCTPLVSVFPYLCTPVVLHPTSSSRQYGVSVRPSVPGLTLTVQIGILRNLVGILRLIWASENQKINDLGQGYQGQSQGQKSNKYFFAYFYVKISKNNFPPP